MAQVPVDIKVDIDGLGAFKKLERNFKRLEKLTSDLLVKLNTATAERQLRGLDRDVDRLKKSAGNVVVGFNVDKSGLRNAKRELQGVSGGGGRRCRTSQPCCWCLCSRWHQQSGEGFSSSGKAA